ncbi:MAG: hypothetical protein F6K65_05735 [Moorea sp. SIO3C2]|nr:hypothetical protein [Moorena sp. SIO3C2]
MSNQVYRIFPLLPIPDSRFPTPDSPYPKTKVPPPIDNWYSKRDSA